ncbi:MAG: pentapeptide repeat-containing protein [Methanothrix sp.]|nr:pentapeptide repeat-containing protein [Methanothrix sp.]
MTQIPLRRSLPTGLLLLLLILLLLAGAAAQESGFGAIPPASEASGRDSIISAHELISEIRSGSHLNYSNMTIKGRIDLIQLDAPIRQSIRIINSRFLGPVRMEGITFAQGLDLRGCDFEDNVSFVRSRFLGEAKFSGARFLKQVDFSDTYFEETSSFISTRFSGDSSFSSAQFYGDAVFLAASFASDVDFDDAKFMRSGSFRSTAFEDVRFFETEFAGQATFLSAFFQGNATFAATRFQSDVVFRQSRFLQGSTFGLSSFAGLADFGGVEFSDTAFFGGVKFSDLAYFASAFFSRDLILEGARLYSMQLDDVSFAEKSRVNLNSTDFTKFVVRWSSIRDRMIYNGAAYLALVKNYKSLEWFDDADDCYYQYRKIGQDREPWSWSKVSDIISWLSCGYGVRVSYTVFWCLFTILFFGVIFWAGKGMNKFEIEGMELPGDHRLKPSKRVSFTDALYFSIAMFTTSQAPVNTYPVGFYRHLAMAEGILGWFFLGLFVVVLSAVLIR